MALDVFASWMMAAVQREPQNEMDATTPVIRGIQQRIGQRHGDMAGHFFTGDKTMADLLANARNDNRRGVTDILVEYLEFEKLLAVGTMKKAIDELLTTRQKD